MPAEQRGQPYRLAPHRWGLRYYGQDGNRVRTKEKFQSKTAALNHYRDVILPRLRGDHVQPADLTLSEFIPVYLERHGATVRPRTVATLTERLRHACYRVERETEKGIVTTWRVDKTDPDDDTKNQGRLRVRRRSSAHLEHMTNEIAARSRRPRPSARNVGRRPPAPSSPA